MLKIFLIAIVTFSINSSQILKSCTGEYIQDLNASYIIGGLFPVHRFKDNRYEFNVEAVVWVEAFLFAIKQINENDELLPGISLGYDIRDSCDDQAISKKQILDLMTDIKFFTKNGRHDYQNDAQDGEMKCQCFHENQSQLVGVIGKIFFIFC